MADNMAQWEQVPDPRYPNAVLQLMAKRLVELKQERNRFAYIALVVTCLLIMDVMLR